MKFKRFFLKNLLWLIGSFLIILFLGWHLLSVVLPPKINITQPPTKEFTTNEDKILIRGQAQRAYFLKINDNLIAVDNKGNFEHSFNLQENINLIKIEAETRFGKTNHYTLKILKK